MPIPKKYLADFEENNIYHIYNKTNNKEKLFLSDDNRFFFLKKYKEYLSAFADTYCWCLLPNHFHILIKIKKQTIIKNDLKQKPTNTITEKKYLQNTITFNEFIVSVSKKFFQSYALAFNKVHERSGNLFYTPFKRVLVERDSHFTQAILYIHTNAFKHKLVKNFQKHKWSSYHSLLSMQPTSLLRNEILEWFGGAEKFIQAHKNYTGASDTSFVQLEE